MTGMEAEVRELSPLYGQQQGQRIEGQRIVKRYDAPKWAAASVVAIASILVFLLLGVIRLFISMGS
jgi:hypothetical protein